MDNKWGKFLLVFGLMSLAFILLAVFDNGGGNGARLDVVRAPDLELCHGVKVRGAHEGANNIQDELGDAVDDRLEGVTDNNGDGELDHVALGDELLEALEHGGRYLSTGRCRARTCSGTPLTCEDSSA